METYCSDSLVPGANHFALFENSKAGTASLFCNPVEHIFCTRKEDIEGCLGRIQTGLDQGLYAAGYLAYECGYYLVDKQSLNQIDHQLRAKNGKPAYLINYFLFEQKVDLNRDDIQQLLDSSQDRTPPAISRLRQSMSEADYLEALARVRQYIRDGDTYQVNFTFKYQFDYNGSPTALYNNIKQRQQVEHGAYLNFPGHTILSFSPELFIKKEGSHLYSKPMKGTMPRSNDPQQNLESIAFMKQDPKTLSENVMIVDLIRNDLGRIANTGTVNVDALFDVEEYKTVLQMTSTISCQVDPDISITDLLKALYPCGSITGAPKQRTMEIIAELEAENRGVYTGAIGYMTPGNDIYFNVPIRTCVLFDDNTAEMGIGSGVIYDSDAQKEFNECLLKARFLVDINSGFELIEALHYDGASNTLNRLEYHLNRLENSAKVFAFAFNRGALVADLHRLIATLEKVDYKVRVSLDRLGAVSISADKVSAREENLPAVIGISDVAVERNNIFQYHKTTHRDLYESQFKDASARGLYDVLFLNEEGELTEASRHNLFLVKDGIWYTPPTSCGLLNGIKRRTILESSHIKTIEKKLYLQDLLDADRIVLTNSVRGIVDVRLQDQLLRDISKGAKICFA